MYHILHSEKQETYKVAILTKRQALNKENIEFHYIEPMGISLDSVVSFSLEQTDYKKKPKASEMKEYLAKLLPVLDEAKVKLLYVTDGNWFKTLTKVTKIDPNYGYVLPCKITGYEHMQVVLSCNYQALFMNETLQSKIDLANKTAKSFLANTYEEIGTNIIHYEEYIPANPVLVKQKLEELHKYDSITIDTETYSLRHTHAGLGTIGFAWSKHEGICIDVSHSLRTTGIGFKSRTLAVEQAIKDFLINYKGNIKFHNASYDIKILIYKLWMKDLLDTEGLLEGLEVLTRDFDDTKLISYLATNSCAGNKLSLKEQAHEFAGNYAVEDINDITLIPNDQLMKYNLIDCLSTWFVYEKNYPIMVQDQQEETYKFFKKILINIIQMELTGMPINMARTKEVDKHIKDIIDDNWSVLHASPKMQKFIKLRKEQIRDEKNAGYKNKVITTADVKYEFNPNSGKELIKLLHDFFGFEIYETTDTGLPAVGGKELKGHRNRTNDEDIRQVINAIMKILEGDKIRNTFIAKFLEADEGPDGWHYLFGSFNLGGTKSGRLSSSNPNLQNLPSGSTYGKLVKTCFSAPPGIITLNYPKLKGIDVDEHNIDILVKLKNLAIGNVIKANKRKEADELIKQLTIDVKDAIHIDVGWLFYGLDYASLEDRINTLLTKDPNKVKVYTDGYDGHSLRAFAYFKHEMPDIIDTVESINSIADLYDKLRSKSKAPTFALTYQGTWKTLVTNCGFSEEEAKETEARYHDLYKVSDAWVQSKLDQATLDGYVTLAFGLRLRTPILRKTVLGSRYTPYQAAAEARTAGNAVSGQSYGLLNSRAGVELQERTLASKHRLDIRPSAHIHDAQYGLVRNTPEAVAWLNQNITECVDWQELPEIQHDEVKLTGDLGIFYPNWSNEITIKNHTASVDEVIQVCKEGVLAYEAKANMS